MEEKYDKQMISGQEMCAHFAITMTEAFLNKSNGADDVLILLLFSFDFVNMDDAQILSWLFAYEDFSLSILGDSLGN